MNRADGPREAGGRRVALVSGASRGIGRAVALGLAEDGFDLVLGYAKNADLAEAVAREAEARGVRAVPIALDVRDPKAAEAAVEAALEAFGRLDVLVNNAGITRDQLLVRMKADDWDEVLRTNLTGAFYLTKAAARPMMRARYGRIVNIASVVARLGNVGQANYVAAKAGLIGLTKAAALELASRGITVNAVAPGFITTDMTEALPEAVKAELIRRIPLGVFGAPEDVAHAVRFLVSEGARYITGQVLGVDGGMSMPS
ncbi:MAG: 3-oxoacyl-[acyl-carrier-protein] reductase [Hydrogenibacillus schlegelii]|uniref:3-oxoacyl-[acyl-carrier-protein] reductase n=1 Tax=Hydrogenibacillus schlegelii TaxID=1484 RepID=A0A2T5GFD6_HYDSH|nr:3-oxoacyl-[acyl-carrier-protein] reductase [Hydrogenibacillus schlegelii]MBT9281499.1 3-oxoacyl-[acyl-carrier-protein] reductase [Hydrogenibacillus schlegelii]PTQ54898.1 MAG: 3-oxoacyl-[acyl-carrier protein] reductase [Hydrogenibacillus schlegelii]